MLAVSSIEEEEAYLGACTDCGGKWAVVHESVHPLSGGRWADELVMRCAGCHTAVSLVFDITSFFVADPRVWARWPAA